MIDRDTALGWLEKKVSNDNLIKHMIATEAIMRSLAIKLGKDEQLWSLTGLLHDLDFEQTKENPDKHGLLTVLYLKEQGIEDERMFKAILSHNQERTGVKRETALDFALTAAEQISGLIVGCALVRPDKKLASVLAKSVAKKFRQPAFTAKVDRELIELSAKLKISLSEFIELSLKAMQDVAEELGL